jgi:transcription termination/antitermination protein NusG
MIDAKENENEMDSTHDEFKNVEERYGFAKGDAPDFKWYIIRTKTGQENKVVKALKERIVSQKLTDFFADIMTPEDTVTSNVNGKKRTIKKKVFPGYVLIKMIMNDSSWHMVKAIDKISGFVGGTSDKPSPISESEAAFMTNQNTKGFKRVKSSIDFSEGETVKVIEGPFSSFVGVVESVNEKGKIKVSVSIFGRPTPVELEFSQVEKVSS